MKTLFLIACCSWFAGPAQAAKLRIVATVPELADISRRIGGDWVEVETLARGTEDIHQVVMRPSFVSKLNRAEAVVYLGLGLEHSFLPGLLDVAANPKMRSDITRECAGPGCIDCSAGIAVLEKPDTLSRAEGELHAQGNPHYNLAPDNGPLIARNIEAGLARIAPEHAAEFERNRKAYLSELDAKIAEWKRWAAPLKGMKAVSYHKDQAYVARFTGLVFVDTIELKPGVSPTPTHMVKLVEAMKTQDIKLIIREQHFSPKEAEWLAAQTGARIAVVGVMANAFANSDTFVKMSEHNLRAILKAAGKEPS